MDWTHTDRGHVEEWRVDVGDGLLLWVQRGWPAAIYASARRVEGGLRTATGGSIVLVSANGDSDIAVVQWRLVAKLRRYGAVSDEQGREWARD